MSNKSKRWAKEKAETGTMDFLAVLTTWAIVSSLERHKAKLFLEAMFFIIIFTYLPKVIIKV